MQSDGKRFCEDVVLDSFNSDENSISWKANLFILSFKIFFFFKWVIEEYAFLKKYNI